MHARIVKLDEAHELWLCHYRYGGRAAIHGAIWMEQEGDDCDSEASREM
jgi:hypothetical protein